MLPQWKHLFCTYGRGGVRKQKDEGRRPTNTDCVRNSVVEAERSVLLLPSRVPTTARIVRGVLDVLLSYLFICCADYSQDFTTPPGLLDPVFTRMKIMHIV